MPNPCPIGQLANCFSSQRSAGICLDSVDATTRSCLLLGLLIGGLTLYRTWVLANSGLNLYVDEAYYWGWAQHLDWGYYSKPPMIAALIALTTGLGGDTVFAVKFGAIVAYPITTLLIFKLGQVLFNNRVGLWAAALFILMPGVSLSSLIASTDVLLLLFWTLALLAFVLALQTGQRRYWVLAGIAGGLGLLSKYTMVLFLPAALLAMLLQPAWRQQLRSPWPWVSAGIALLVFLPNLLWNAQHGWPTVQHTVEISHLEQAAWHWDELGEFLGGQFGVFGPLSMAFLVVAMFGLARRPNLRLLAIFTLLFLVVIGIQALLGGANANWAVPAFVAGSVLVAAWMQSHPRWLAATLVLNVALMLGFYHYDPITSALGIELNSKNDPFKRVRGWNLVGEQFAERQSEVPESLVMSEDREILSQLAFERDLPMNQLRSWNPENKIRHHYDLVYSLSGRDVGANILFVSRSGLSENMAEHFSEVRRLTPLNVEIHPDWKRHYEVYWLQNYQGDSSQDRRLAEHPALGMDKG